MSFTFLTIVAFENLEKWRKLAILQHDFGGDFPDVNHMPRHYYPEKSLT